MILIFLKTKKDGSTGTQIKMFSCLKKIEAALQLEDVHGRGGH